MSKMTRRTFMGVGTAAAVVACGQVTRSPEASPQTNKPQRGVINLYSSRHYDSDDAIYKGFMDATGIRVNLIEAEADPLIERIKNEGANSPADVLLTVDGGRLWRAEQEGIFQPVNSALLKQSVPENLRHPEGLWFGFSKRARVIMYNKEQVDPSELSTYEALVDPKWRGQILIRSSSNIYNVSLTAALLEALGAAKTEEWARGLVANFARQPEGNDTAQIQACAAGVGSLAVANTYYLARLAKSEKPEEKAIAEKVGIFFPNQSDRGTHVNISGGGVLKHAPNKEGALQFLEYLASAQAQELFAKGNNEYPVLKSAKEDPILTSYGSFKEDPTSAIVYGRRSAESLQVMDRAGWA